MALHPEQIGRMIQACRKERDMTQTELGERLGVSSQSVSNWERGESLPDLALLVDMADIFDRSLDSIIRSGAGEYRRRVTVAQMREAIECIHRLHDLMGREHFIYQTMVSALDRKMNSEIEPAFTDPVVMDAYVCEALIACVRDGGDWVDLDDVRRNIASEKPREWTLKALKRLGMK